MTKTAADKQRDYRQRRAEELATLRARVAELEEALAASTPEHPHQVWIDQAIGKGLTVLDTHAVLVENDEGVARVIARAYGKVQPFNLQ